MKFSDTITRDSLEIVFVKRTEKEMAAREEYNSNLWDLEYRIGKDVFVYSVPARDIKIGENIYDKTGKFIAYRSE